MSNSFYNHGAFPSTGSAATSASMRAELDLVSAGFDKMPTLAGNANKFVIVNSTGTGLTQTDVLPAFSVNDTDFTVQDDGDNTRKFQFNAGSITTGNTRIYSMPDLDTTLVGTNVTQTLTNKTLTAPVIATIVNTGTLTLPTSTDTLIGRNTTDTLTNKTLTNPVIGTIINTGTLTLPTSTDTLVGRATTDTLSNKSISGASNTLANIGNSSLTNSSVVIGSTTLSLGGTMTTLAGVTISGASNTLTNIANASLTNSGVTFNGVSVALGASGTITASTTNALTVSTGLQLDTGTTFNGGAARTISIDSTVATLSGAQTLSNKVISGSSNTLSNIANASLTNSSITIGSSAISLGSTATTISGLTSLSSTGLVMTANAASSTAISAIAQSAGTVTVTAAGHGLSSSDLVSIDGVADYTYTGLVTVNVTNANVFTYSRTTTNASSSGGYVTKLQGTWASYSGGTGPSYRAGPSVYEANSRMPALRVTQSGNGYAFIVEDAANPDTSAFIIANDGSLSINTNKFTVDAATGNTVIAGTLTLAGGINLNGNVTVGDASSDTLTINSTITSNLIFTDNTYDIGASGATRPRNLYLAGSSTIGGGQSWGGDVVFQNNAANSETAKLIRSNAFGAAIRFAANGTTATDRNLGLGYVNNAAAFTPILTIGDQVAQVATNFSVSVDNTYDIGASGTRFKALYLSGSEYIAGNIYQNASTASAWDSNWQALQGSSGSFSQLSTGQDVRIYMNGAVVGAAEKYVATGFASVERMTANGINWTMYASASAGTSFGTPTGRMFFTQSGRLGVGYAVTQTPNTMISTLGGDFSVSNTASTSSTNIGNLRSYSDYSGSNFELTRMEMNTKGAADDGEYNFYTRYATSLVSRLRLGRDGVIGGLFGANGVTVASYPFDGINGTATGANATGWVFNAAMGVGGGSYYGNGAGILLRSYTNNNTTAMGGISAHLVGGGTGGAATDESGGLAFWVKNTASTTTTKGMWLLSGSRLGVGSEPSTWNIPVLDVGTYASVSSFSNGVVYLSNNLYNDGSWRTKSTAYGNLYEQVSSDGSHTWFSTTSSTSIGTVATTLTKNMLLTRGGFLQVGYTGGAAPSGNSIIEAVASGNNASITAIQGTSQFQLQSNSQDGYLNMSGNGNLYFRFGSTPNLKATLGGNTGNLSLSGSIFPTAEYTTSVSISGNASNTWYTIVTPGNLTTGAMYWVTFRWDHGGSGGPYIVAGAFMFANVNTNGTGTGNTFTPMCSTHTGGGDTISFRSLAGTSSNTGMQYKLDTFAGNGNLGISFYRFS